MDSINAMCQSGLNGCSLQNAKHFCRIGRNCIYKNILNLTTFRLFFCFLFCFFVFLSAWKYTSRDLTETALYHKLHSEQCLREW